MTALVGWISNATGLSVSKHVPLWELLWFSIVANMSITGMNLSLMLNSVGFYQVHCFMVGKKKAIIYGSWYVSVSDRTFLWKMQISKLSIIPVVCLMEYFLHSKHYSSRVIMAVTAVAVGVGICTVTDVEIKNKGLLCACVAVFCTSLQQIVSILTFLLE